MLLKTLPRWLFVVALLAALFGWPARAVAVLPVQPNSADIAESKVLGAQFSTAIDSEAASAPEVGDAAEENLLVGASPSSQPARDACVSASPRLLAPSHVLDRLDRPPRHR